MNRDEIGRLAAECGVISWVKHEWSKDQFVHTDEGMDGDFAGLCQFAALVAAAAKEEMLMAGNDQWLEEARKAEREACAKLAESKASVGNASNYPTYIAAAIRARGQA
jgi:hypothetical protein